MPVVAGLPHELDGEASRSEERLPSRFPDDEPIEPPSEGPEADNKVVGQPQPCAAKSFDTPPPPLEKPTDGDAPPKPLPRSPKPDTPPEPLEHKPIEPPPLVVAPFSAEVARQHQEAWAKHLGLVLEVTNSIGMKLVLLPPGEFVMGSPVSETDRGDDEDQHPRRITKAFYLGIYEVTQAEYERVTKTNPSSFSADGPHQSRTSKLDTSRRPVEAVSWDDAVAFCNELSTCADEQRARRKYRLPTEEEWEYACRAGSTGPFHFGATLNGREANCNGGSPYGTTVKGSNRLRTTNVGLYPPNAWGLHDMHGNVWEWCLDAYTPKDALDRTSGLPRALRGGSWSNRPVHCRSAFRHSEAPAARRDFIGFRVACDCE
jgi:formylglycine-generating enzyme required for sulfatase activity